jgi:outer membrane scaffolding protein for murein synthesis (MipA/OmpV family)
MNIIKYLLSLLFLTLFSNLIYADEVKVGAGLFTTSLPDYLGSSEQSNYTVPFPYIYYKNKNFKIERNALTGFMWQSNDWYLDMSMSGGVPVKSDDNELRSGMSDIDWVAELGPAIKYYAYGQPKSAENLHLAFSVRKALATDFSHLDNVGWQYVTALNHQKSLGKLAQGTLRLSSSIKVNYGDDRYLNYYFGVTEQEETTYRAKFKADSGYQSTSINLGLSWKKEQWLFGTFAKYHLLNNSAQENSPLVTENTSWYIGFGLAWIFYSDSNY